MLRRLINSISKESITNFFSLKVSAFKPDSRRLDEWIKDFDNNRFRDLFILGEVEYSNSDELLVFSCKFLGELSARSSKRLQYDLAKKVLRQEFKDAAIFVFYDELGKFRFSFIRTNYIGTKRDYSTWKRYTYFIDPGKPNKTFVHQLDSCSFDTLDSILKAFSIEAVTESFYNEFTPTFNSLANTVKGTAEFEQKKNFALLFTIRIIFIGFVQKRKWLGEDEEFLQNTWIEYKSSLFGKNLFYKKWLEPLFFEALNSPPGREVSYGDNLFSDKVRKALKMAPYLNGEIFNRKPGLDTEGFYLPDTSIEAFFDFLFQYNFTIEENTNYDEELELNPEFLGIIFERLVNKEDGAVYTPRIEVDFMCRISLVKWLQNVSRADINDLYCLFFRETGTEQDQKQGDFSSKQIEELLHLLKNVSTCDPSSGSGAFPVGMMQVLNEIIENLQNRHNTPEQYKNEDAFERKKAIIANSLYGVEVKLWAVWINQLRLWLSLFVDVPYDREDEFKLSMEPLLPNLDFKIRQGDSLVQRIGEKHFPVQGHGLIQTNSLKGRITKLKKEKKDFFYNRSGSYKHIKSLESEIFRAVIDEQILEKKKSIQPSLHKKEVQTDMFDSNVPGTTKIHDDETVQQIQAEIAALEAEKTAFRDDHPLVWNIEFSEIFYEKGGFDVIIGNPPYVRQEAIADPLGKVVDPKAYKSLLQETMRVEFPNHFVKKEKIDGKSDLYTYFYLKSLRLLNPNGIHTFICSNSWLDVGYGTWMQKFLLENCKVHFIIDNHAKRSFANADVNTIISVINAPVKLKRTLSLSTPYKFIAFKKSFEEAIFSEYLLQIEKQQSEILKNEVFRSFPITIQSLLQEGAELDPEDGQHLETGHYAGDKWGGKYLRAPDIYFTVLTKGKNRFKKLSEVATLKRGITTGCNDFFYLTKEKVDQWGIEKEFLKPVIKSSKESSSTVINTENLKFRLFYCPKTKRELKGTRALAYILNGEKSSIQSKQGKDKGKTIIGYHNIPSLKARKKWWDLGIKEIPDGIVPSGFGEIFRFFHNNEKILADKRLYLLFGDTEVLNFMNSTLFPLFLEVGSRVGLGDGLLDLTVEEYQKIYVLYPPVTQKLDDRPILSIFKECGIDPTSSIPISDQEPDPLPDRKALDDAVFDALDLTAEERKEVYRAACQLVWNRVSKAKSVKKT